MKVIYKNKTSTDIYKNNIDIVKKMVNEFSELLDFDLNLKVYFVPINNEDNDTAAGVVRKDDKWFILNIYDCAFNSCKYSIETVIFHEFAHIYDIYHTFMNESFNCIGDKGKKNSLENLIKCKGFSYWTEFFAHYKCFENELCSLSTADTLLQLVQKYKKIIDKQSEVDSMINDGENIKNIKSEISEIVKLINQFIYSSSRYIASLTFRKSLYEYSEKHTTKKEFNDVIKINSDLYRLISKMTHGTYGKYLGKRLYKLGSYIFDEIYARFNIRMYIHKSSIGYEYMLENNEIKEK